MPSVLYRTKGPLHNSAYILVYIQLHYRSLWVQQLQSKGGVRGRPRPQHTEDVGTRLGGVPGGCGHEQGRQASGEGREKRGTGKAVGPEQCCLIVGGTVEAILLCQVLESQTHVGRGAWVGGVSFPWR